MSDGNGIAKALLGLHGFRVLAVSETVEVVIETETTADLVGCDSCGVRAEPRERMNVEARDLVCFGRPAASRAATPILGVMSPLLRCPNHNERTPKLTATECGIETAKAVD